MPVLPSKIQDLLDFCDAHTSIFTANAASIGISAPQALAFKNASGKARADFNAAFAADEAKKTAVMTSQQSVRALRKLAGETINLIKSFAEASATPSVVYGLASIPMPAMPGPAPAPGTPTDFLATINQSGAVKLTWKCPNPAGIGGTTYKVERKIGSGGFVGIGFNGKREFTDANLPAGSIGVTYQVTAFRSTLSGDPAQFNVNFGVTGGGGLFITSTSEGSGPMKMAA